MNSMKRPYSVLVVSGQTKGSEFIRALLPPQDFAPIAYASSVSETQRILINSVYDIIVIDTPLPDRFGYELAVDLAQNTQSGIMLLVRNDIFDDIADKVGDSGVLTVAKPLTRQGFYRDIRLLTATRERLAAAESRNITLEEKLSELRVVNHAKWALIEHTGISEHEAHKYIERQAMNNRLSKRKTAEDIIRKYEGR